MSGPSSRTVTCRAESRSRHTETEDRASETQGLIPLQTLAITCLGYEAGLSLESRSIKTMAIAENLGGIAFPHAVLAIRIHRRRKESGKKETRRTDYAVTSLDAHQATPEALAAFVRGRWGIENSSHHIRDVTFAEDASTVHAGAAPRAMAAFRNLAIGALKILGATNIAKTTRAISAEPERALPILGIHLQPNPSGT